jgi:hypothetical protein
MLADSSRFELGIEGSYELLTLTISVARPIVLANRKFRQLAGVFTAQDKTGSQTGELLAVGTLAGAGAHPPKTH